jgi:hypothetical protein
VRLGGLPRADATASVDASTTAESRFEIVTASLRAPSNAGIAAAAVSVARLAVIGQLPSSHQPTIGHFGPEPGTMI